MDGMAEFGFRANGWFKISTRGDVATFGADQIPAGMWDPSELQGQHVMIDGKKFRVLGVETFSVPRSPSQPYKKPFGLLVGKG